MVGRITSRNPAVNGQGVPYARVLELEREAHRRHRRVLAEALRCWVDLERARREASPDAERLYREALELTRKALA
jgi:hypothetical protein